VTSRYSVAQEIQVKCEYSKLVDPHILVPHPKNSNKHNEKQISMLAKIIAYQGFRSPIVVSNRSGYVVVGHGRLAAALQLDMPSVPVDYQDFANEAEEFQHLIADNKIAELAEHDDQFMVESIKEFDLIDSDLQLLGLDDFSIFQADYDTEEKEQKEEEKKYAIQVEFPNDMEMNDTKDELLNRGFIVRVL